MINSFALWNLNDCGRFDNYLAFEISGLFVTRIGIDYIFNFYHRKKIQNLRFIVERNVKQSHQKNEKKEKQNKSQRLFRKIIRIVVRVQSFIFI